MRCTTYRPAYLAPIAIMRDAKPGGFTITELARAGLLAARAAIPHPDAPTQRIDARAVPMRHRYPFSLTQHGNGPVSAMRLTDTGMRCPHSGETLFTVT